MSPASTAEITRRRGMPPKRAIFSRMSSRERAVRAQHEDVGLDADAPQLVDRVLGGLGLQLAHRVEVRHERHVDEADVLAADVVAQLADGLEERQRLDVAHRSADLDDDDLGVRARRRLADAPP